MEPTNETRKDPRQDPLQGLKQDVEKVNETNPASHQTSAELRQEILDNWETASHLPG